MHVFGDCFSVVFMEKQNILIYLMNECDIHCNVQYSFILVICFIYLRRTETTRGIEVHNLGEIDKQLHVAAESDHKKRTEMRFWRVHVHQRQCVGKTRCAHSTSR